MTTTQRTLFQVLPTVSADERRARGARALEAEAARAGDAAEAAAGAGARERIRAARAASAGRLPWVSVLPEDVFLGGAEVLPMTSTRAWPHQFKTEVARFALSATDAQVVARFRTHARVLIDDKVFVRELVPRDIAAAFESKARRTHPSFAWLGPNQSSVNRWRRQFERTGFQPIASGRKGRQALRSERRTQLDAATFAVIEQARNSGIAVHLRDVCNIRVGFSVLDYLERLKNDDTALGIDFDEEHGNSAEQRKAQQQHVLALRRTFNRTWASRELRLRGFTLRAATKAQKRVNDDPARIDNFVVRLAHALEQFNVPDALVINMDQSPQQISAAQTTTFEKKGRRDAAVRGKDDKRQVTIQYAIPATGDARAIKTQIIFNGKSYASLHQKSESPYNEEFIFAATPDHRATVETMLQWIDDGLEPYLVKQREIHGVEQVAILIMDVWWAHFDGAVLDRLGDIDVYPIFVEPNLTATLSPLDAKNGLNRLMKPLIRRHFNDMFIQQLLEPLGFTIDLASEQLGTEEEGEKILCEIDE